MQTSLMSVLCACNVYNYSTIVGLSHSNLLFFEIFSLVAQNMTKPKNLNLKKLMWTKNKVKVYQHQQMLLVVKIASALPGGNIKIRKKNTALQGHIHLTPFITDCFTHKHHLDKSNRGYKEDLFLKEINISI